MSRRREVEVFSLSFLDAICCGFGAVIMLLVLNKAAEPRIIEQARVDRQELIAALEKELFQIRGQTDLINRDMVTVQEQLSLSRELLARLQGDLSKLRGQFAASNARGLDAETQGELLAARQQLTDEMRRLLADYRPPTKDTTVGGIPVDSEYIIFVIDTSGSMFSYAWERMLEELQATLSIYPEVKGIQVLNDMGKYMFSRYRGQWIPDTAGRRKVIMENLRNWNVFSNSSPVEGIEAAIRAFHKPGQKISIYVFGDEFTGNSIAQVIDTVDRINQSNAKGERLVRIHAVGFPVQFIRAPHLQTTGIRFATLMRELTYRNGGTFVGLNDFRP
jgi:hypothetical protein